MLNTSRRFAAAGMSIAALALSLTVAGPATTASADPGFCGVRAGVSGGSGPADVIYTVQNRCSSTHSFKVYLPAPGRTSQCQSAPPGGYAYFLFSYADRDWQVLACS
ncbi:hypothetical protein ACWCYY_00005 [Kitasatospora sp. NPDC001664]